jgi:hypothetical protein
MSVFANKECFIKQEGLRTLMIARIVMKNNDFDENKKPTIK